LPQHGVPRDALNGLHKQLAQANVADARRLLLGRVDKLHKAAVVPVQLLEDLLRLVLVANVCPVRLERFERLELRNVSSAKPISTYMTETHIAQRGGGETRGVDFLEIIQKRLCSGEHGVNVSEQCFGVVFRNNDRVALLCEEAQRASIVL
jgi:hypothetical protein